jgi:hypothetical protein
VSVPLRVLPLPEWGFTPWRANFIGLPGAAGVTIRMNPGLAELT